MLSFDKSEAYIIIFGVNYNGLQWILRLLTIVWVCNQLVDYKQLSVIVVTYNQLSSLLPILGDSLDYEWLLHVIGASNYYKQLYRLQYMYTMRNRPLGTVPRHNTWSVR